MSTTTLVDTDICPACLTELPADYPYDHVAIDRAASGDRNLFAGMRPDEKREVVTTALARGARLHDLVKVLSWPYNRLQDHLPDDHPESAPSQTARVEHLVRELWELGLPDATIAARTGLNPSKVGRVRGRLGLDTLPRRARQVTA